MIFEEKYFPYILLTNQISLFYFLQKYQVYKKTTFCVYGLHSLQGQFTGFYFLSFLLKAFTVSNCFNSLGTISHILGPRTEMLSVPLKTLRTFGLVNSEGFRMS